MAYEELTAADRYVTAESRDNEPISSMKQPGEKCDLCECNPCQCGKMKHSGGGGNNPYEVRRVCKGACGTELLPVGTVHSMQAVLGCSAAGAEHRSLGSISFSQPVSEQE